MAEWKQVTKLLLRNLMMNLILGILAPLKFIFHPPIEVSSHRFYIYSNNQFALQIIAYYFLWIIL